MKLSRPLLRYHGGKWLLAPWIIDHFPPHRVYTDSFGGGGSVLLRKERSYAEIYNDLDSEVVNVFRIVRDHGEELELALRATPFARDEFKQSSEVCECPFEQARRTIIRSHMGFGSNAINRNIRTGFRANSNRSGTTPARDWSNLPACVREVVERLRGVVLENRPAAEIMLQHDGKKTLHYVDPPYVHSTRSNLMHGSGYAYEMTDEDHRSLARVLNSLRGMIVLSGYPSDLYEELYGDWERVERDAFADGARKRTEVLWLRNTAKGLFA